MIDKKLFIIINTLDKGGAERIASEFSFYLEKNGYLPVFLLTDKAPLQYEIAPHSQVVSLPLSSHIRGIFFPLIIVIQAIYIRIKFGANFKAISFLHRANIVNGLAAWFSNRKVVISERSVFSKSYSGFKYYLMKTLLKILFYRSNSVIAVSGIVKKELIEVFKINQKKIVTIHNPISTDKFFFSKTANNFISNKNNLNFCTVGRLIPSKRVHIVIELFDEILKYKPQSVLHILGEGKEKNNLMEQAKHLGILDKIIFYGNVDDVFSIIKDCDIFLFASAYESFGNVALEATSTGLPVVYTSNLASFNEIYASEKNLSFSFDEKPTERDVQSILNYIESIKYEDFKDARNQFLKRHDKNDIFERYLNELNN